MSEKLREYRKLCIVIKQLYDYSNLEWEKIRKVKPTKHAQTIDGYISIENKSIPIDKISLKKAANEYNTREPYIETKKPLILPPMEKYNVEFIPTLMFDCDFSTNIPSVRYNLCLLEIYQEEDNERYRYFNFRYELGHDGPNHNYPHAQLSRAGEYNNRYDWIPEHIPAFPLYADSAISLLLCLIISLYSAKKSGNIVESLNIDEKYKSIIRSLIK